MNTVSAFMFVLTFNINGQMVDFDQSLHFTKQECEQVAQEYYNSHKAGFVRCDEVKAVFSEEKFLK